MLLFRKSPAQMAYAFPRKDVRFELGGNPIAETERAMILMETGLSLRYYLPKEDILWEYLGESDKQTVCPYKGRSRYWSIRAGGEYRENAAWAYPDPLQDAERVRGTVCFYQEKLTVFVDGEQEELAHSYFTK